MEREILYGFLDQGTQGYDRIIAKTIIHNFFLIIPVIHFSGTTRVGLPK